MRKISEYRSGAHVAKVYRDASANEYVVKPSWRTPEADYHTPDKDDALGTAKRMVVDFVARLAAPAATLALEDAELMVLLGLLNYVGTGRNALMKTGPVLTHRSLQGRWSADIAILAAKMLDEAERRGVIVRPACFAVEGSVERAMREKRGEEH